MNLRRLTTLAIMLPAVTVLTGLLTISTLAATPRPAAAETVTPAVDVNTNTCTFWRANHGPWGITKAFVNRNLVWTASSNASGSRVTLAANADKLTQCWKLLGGFGNARFEFQMAGTSLCLNVAGASRNVGASLIVYPCLSQINELFFGATLNQRTQFQSANSGLCIEARGGVNAGAGLIQNNCSHYGPWQSWFLS
jgi:Ricin-type beta-trefoil lectin domain